MIDQSDQRERNGEEVDVGEDPPIPSARLYLPAVGILPRRFRQSRIEADDSCKISTDTKIVVQQHFVVQDKELPEN